MLARFIPHIKSNAGRYAVLLLLMLLGVISGIRYADICGYTYAEGFFNCTTWLDMFALLLLVRVIYLALLFVCTCNRALCVLCYVLQYIRAVHWGITVCVAGGFFAVVFYIGDIIVFNGLLAVLTVTGAHTKRRSMSFAADKTLIGYYAAAIACVAVNCSLLSGLIVLMN